jgi:hypothetical protein
MARSSKRVRPDWALGSLAEFGRRPTRHDQPANPYLAEPLRPVTLAHSGTSYEWRCRGTGYVRRSMTREPEMLSATVITLGMGYGGPHDVEATSLIVFTTTLLIVVFGVAARRIAHTGVGRRSRRRRVSLRGVISARERWSLLLMLEQALNEHVRQQQAEQRRLNSLLKTPSAVSRRLVTYVRGGVDSLRVEHQDGLVLRLSGVKNVMAYQLQASAARDRVELVHGSAREVVYEIRDSRNRRTVLCLSGIRVQRET